MENAPPPKLIEPSMKYHLYDTLRKCHQNRVVLYSYVLNIGILVLFLGTVGFLLYYCYTNKLTDEEKERRMIRDQQYVMSKIRFFQEEKKNQSLSNVANLQGAYQYSIPNVL